MKDYISLQRAKTNVCWHGCSAEQTLCLCDSQLGSLAPAASRYRSRCHLCRDTTPPAPRSAWWLNVSTACPRQGDTNIQISAWIVKHHSASRLTLHPCPKAGLLAEAVETLPQQDPVSRLQIHEADPALHRLGVWKQVLSVQHHQAGKVFAALVLSRLTGRGIVQWNSLTRLPVFAKSRNQIGKHTEAQECSHNELTFYF